MSEVDVIMGMINRLGFDYTLTKRGDGHRLEITRTDDYSGSYIAVEYNNQREVTKINWC